MKIMTNNLYIHILDKLSNIYCLCHMYVCQFIVVNHLNSLYSGIIRPNVTVDILYHAVCIKGDSIRRLHNYYKAI